MLPAALPVEALLPRKLLRARTEFTSCRAAAPAQTSIGRIVASSGACSQKPCLWKLCWSGKSCMHLTAHSCSQLTYARLLPLQYATDVLSCASEVPKVHRLPSRCWHSMRS